MSLQAIINQAAAVAANRTAPFDYSRTQGGVVKRSRSGPYLYTFEIDAGRPTDAMHRSWLVDFQTKVLGPYVLTMPTRSVGTTGAYDSDTSTPLVAGASQSGSSLNIDGLAVSTTAILKAGDVIQVVGVPFTYRLTADVNSSSSGTATLALDQPLASSPANNAAVRVGTQVQFNTFIESVPLELGSGSLPYNVSYGETFILREGR